MKGTILPATLAVTASGIGVAVWAAGPYNDDGSDTLGDVAPATIAACGANLIYRAMGSGQAETNMNNHTQSLGFMSRNFNQSTLTTHPTWQPQKRNVLGLDAAVLVENNYASRMQDLALAPDPNYPGKALPDSDLALVLGGTSDIENVTINGVVTPMSGASGSTAACRSQARLDALDRLTTAMAVDQINHIFRRNDASGTSDTMKERLRIFRFCNGQAPGGLKSDGVTLNHNSDAEDMDPIRRACVPASGRANATKCTYWPYNVACTAGVAASGVSGVPNGTPCTQGLVVALTDVDPQADDVTMSIAHRVGDDGTHKTLGYSGRAGVKQPGAPTAGPTINRTSYADAIVRLNQYMLSRRLYLNHGDPLPAGHDDQQLQEDTLYNCATDPDNGACVMEPIIKQYGFITCDPSCDNQQSGYNLCRDTPFPPNEALPSLCIATGKLGDGKARCCATGLLSTSGVACGTPVCAASGEPCNVNADCCSGTTCQDTGGVVTICQ
jgi:hypothetical protein